jgi:hypothetical protein
VIVEQAGLSVLYRLCLNHFGAGGAAREQPSWFVSAGLVGRSNANGVAGQNDGKDSGRTE